ncbi:unnamed protein product [Adineta steineri]|uniref:Uncharacterized protein n=1 Tax=Adineta steineri TaxID=433720 RepID=A0A813T1H8_9BILA|nr:unnamed protein product [Adineta steineri]
MILVSINLTPYFGQGPVYPSQKGFESDDCRYVHWWTSILYIGNFINSHEMCLVGRKLISFIIATLFSGPTFYKNIYITPWCRISAYAVGLITGFIVINVGREYRLNKMAKIFGTILIIILTIICLFATYPDYILASGLDRSIVVAYQSLSRTFWAIVIGWILFLCSTHQGGITLVVLNLERNEINDEEKQYVTHALQNTPRRIQL